MKNKHGFLNLSPNKITSQVNKSFLLAGDPESLWLYHGPWKASSIVTNYIVTRQILWTKMQTTENLPKQSNLGNSSG
jgi:hypothetical protein